MFKIKLASVTYSGQDIGNDLKFTLKIGAIPKTFQTTLNLGLTKTFHSENILLEQPTIPNVGTSTPIEVKVVEADIFQDDIGSGHFVFKIPQYSIWDKLYKYTVSVSESSKTARFVFELQIICLHPLFAKLWKNHPANKGIRFPCSNNGSPNFDNQCAIRMSVALVDSSISLSTFNGAFCWHKHGRKHALRAEELANWIATQNTTFGNVIKHRSVTSNNFEDKLGIVFFRNFYGQGNQGDHIDVWNGKKMGSGSSDYFSRSEEVWFWQL